MIDEKKLIEEIDKRIKYAEMVIVKNPADKLDKTVNDTAKSFIEAYRDCKEIIEKVRKNNRNDEVGIND